jgi:hypothetical protein
MVVVTGGAMAPIIWETFALSPTSSVTVSVTTYSAWSGYVCETDIPVAVPPSPKSQLKVTIFVPRPGAEPKPLKKTGCRAAGAVGANTNCAVAVGATVVVVVVVVLWVMVTAPGPTGFSSEAHPASSAATSAVSRSLRMPFTCISLFQTR